MTHLLLNKKLRLNELKTQLLSMQSEHEKKHTYTSTKAMYLQMQKGLR